LIHLLPRLTAGLIAEAIAAINGAIIMGLKRNLAGVAALGANGVKCLTCAALSTLSLAVCTASLTSLRLVGETLLCVKFLLAGSKGEFLSAILADQSLVAVHC
jgi:hypothetical protein